MQYVDGSICYYDNCDQDEMSLIELENLTKYLDYQRIEWFYYLVPGRSIEDRLRPLNSDIDVPKMMEDIRAESNIVVYVEHGVNKIDFDPVKAPLVFFHPSNRMKQDLVMLHHKIVQ